MKNSEEAQSRNCAAGSIVNKAQYIKIAAVVVNRSIIPSEESLYVHTRLVHKKQYNLRMQR